MCVWSQPTATGKLCLRERPRCENRIGQVSFAKSVVGRRQNDRDETEVALRKDRLTHQPSMAQLRGGVLSLGRR